MILNTLSVRETSLFTYLIASADMHFNAVNERTIFLRNDPERGPILRGEICDLGPGCHADLSHVLLEYALSCEGCQDQSKAGELIDCTSERLGRILATRLYQDTPDLSVAEQVSGAFQFILQSMGTEFTQHTLENGLRFDLAHDPLRATAQKRGLSLGLAVAHQGFVTICESMLDSLAPDWTLIRPAKRAINAPIEDVLLQFKP